MGLSVTTGYLVCSTDSLNQDISICLSKIFNLLFKKITYQNETYTKDNVLELAALLKKNESFSFLDLIVAFYNCTSESKNILTIELYDDIIFQDYRYCYKNNTDIKIADVAEHDGLNFMIYVSFCDDGYKTDISESVVFEVFEWKKKLVHDGRLSSDVVFCNVGYGY